MKRILKYIGIIIVVLIMACFIDYKYWNYSLTKEQNSGSKLIKLSTGEVEYVMQGEGPTILISHGGGTGYPQILTYEYLVKAGYRVISPSKPGYLRTNVSVADTFEKQADMFVELLDKLEIKGKVCVLGISMGGPDVLQFALRHPDRTQCIIMQDAISRKYVVSKEAADSILGKIFLNPSVSNFMSYLMYRTAQLSPASVFQTFLEQESTYTTQETRQMAKAMMKDSANVKTLMMFLYQLTPMGRRSAGTALELSLSSNIPRYPLEKITAPALVTHSRVDKDVVIGDGEFTANTIKGAEFYKFDGFGHLFFFGEENAKIEKVVLDFLKRNLSSSR